MANSKTTAVLSLLLLTSQAAQAAGWYRPSIPYVSATRFESGAQCGLDGSIEHRMSDCSERQGAKATRCVNIATDDDKRRLVSCDARPEYIHHRWVLVSLTSDGREVWRDQSTNLVWGDRLDGIKATHYYASGFCADPAVSENARGFSREAFRLADDYEWGTAIENGAKQVLPRMDLKGDPIWTGSVSILSSRLAYAADETFPRSRSGNSLAIRCVLGAKAPIVSRATR